MKVKIIIKPLTLIRLQLIQFLGKQLKPILSSIIIAKFHLFQVERKLNYSPKMESMRGIQTAKKKP